MKPKKLIITIVTLLMIAVIITTQSVLAWLINYRIDFLMVTGEVKISVEGYVQTADEESILEYLDPLLSTENTFSFRDVTMDNFIAFKFKVKNKTEKDASVSMRFADFSEYIFTYFDEYRIEKQSSSNISDELKNKILALAETNTAKLATVIDRVYYLDSDNIRVDLPVSNRYMWEYSCGEKVFDGVYLPGVTTDSGNNKIESEIELYFIIRSNQSQESVELYRRWLLDYGQERLAAKLGYTYEALSPVEQNLVNDYLDSFLSAEFESIRTVENDELASVNLSIRYFEFIGDNVRM